MVAAVEVMLAVAVASVADELDVLARATVRVVWRVTMLLVAVVSHGRPGKMCTSNFVSQRVGLAAVEYVTSRQNVQGLYTISTEFPSPCP